MTWQHIKAIIYVILAVLIIIAIGQYGWPIILGAISVVIIGFLYIVTRIIVEYPDDK